MATPTYDLIDSVTLTGTSTGVTFSGLGSYDYQDLIVVISPKLSIATVRYLWCRINGDTGSSYQMTFGRGYGSNVDSNVFQTTSMNFDNGGQFDDSFDSIFIWQFFDYKRTDRPKHVLFRGNDESRFASFGIGKWTSNSAITQLEFTAEGTNFAADSTFKIFGVVA